LPRAQAFASGARGAPFCPSFAREATSALSTFPLMRVVSASDLPPQKLANQKQAAQELGANPSGAAIS